MKQREERRERGSTNRYNSLKSLCNDPLVHNIAKEKIKKIKIVIDPTNSVTGKKDRRGDPNVSAQWDGSSIPSSPLSPSLSSVSLSSSFSRLFIQSVCLSLSCFLYFDGLLALVFTTDLSDGLASKEMV